MPDVGIVCEYNPFHNGHAYHIRQSRQLAGEDGGVMCVMSGDFVQRGEAACYSKFARAEAACRCGADLVVELPLPWALSSAEGFARGAVGLLSALGAQRLCFGSETGELAPLEQVAQTLLQPGLNADVKERLSRDGNLSYAAARELAVRERLGESAGLLTRSNDILAIEYLKAIYDLHLELTPVPVLRRGGGHDAEGESGFCSAMELRKRMVSGRDLEGEVPEQALRVYERERRQGREIRDRAVFETAILSRLRLFDETVYKGLPDASDGLGERLYHAVRAEAGYDAVLAAAKTKRYAMSRIRRACMCACLGVKQGQAQGMPPYARVLAFNARGRELLRRAERRGAVPVLTKPAAVRQLSAECEEIFELGACAHDFFVLGYLSRAERRPGADWRTGPKILAD